MLAKTPQPTTDQAALDVAMMARCVELSAIAAKNGEFPFAALICRGADVVAEATNQVSQDADVTRHAELIAISQARKALGTRDLLHALFEHRALRDVLVSDPRNTH